MTKREQAKRKNQLDKLELKRAHLDDAIANVKIIINDLKSEEEWVHITNKSHVYPYNTKLSANLHLVYLTIHMLIPGCKLILKDLQKEFKQADKEYRKQCGE